MGTPITTPGSNRDNCPKMSTSCVIWQGPNIPCIDLCAGDSIDEVVFKLATLLCDVTDDVLDITTLQFGVLIEQGVNDPENLKQLLQLIINKIQTLESSGGGNTNKNDDTSNDKTSDVYIVLPPCLYYTNESGDLVTSLPISEYASYLANTICTIILDINNINNYNVEFNSRLSTLESQVSDLQQYTYQIYVTSQCASAPTPGQTLLIEEAFANLEASFCTLQGSIGLSTQLIAAVNAQCSSLSTLPVLFGTGVMSDVSGWINAPITVADTINNLWLTVCDIRNKLANYFSLPVVLPCILAVPENITVLTIGTAYSTITWTAPSLSGIEVPIGYRIEVFEWTGVAPTGPSVFDNTYSAITFSANITAAGIVIGTQYVVYVRAIYSCGESNGAPVVSDLLVPAVLFYINVNDSTSTPDSTIYCEESALPVAYTAINRKTEVALINAITGLPVINGGVSNIEVTLRYAVTSCSFYGTAYIDVIIPIAPGNSDETYFYQTETYNNCGTALCTVVNTVLDCQVSVNDMNTEFNPTNLFPVCI